MFLRALAKQVLRLGIAWYYVGNDDGGSHGRHTEWWSEGDWRNLNPELFLRHSNLPTRSVAALEESGVRPPETIFHREPVLGRNARALWCDRMNEALDKADLVFLDPDNGIGKQSVKHATHAELGRLRRAGRPVAFITFPGRQSTHDVLVSNLHQGLKSFCGASSAMTLRTLVSVPREPGSRYVVQRQRWFTVTDDDDVLIERVRNFAGAVSNLRRAKASLHI